MDIKNIEMPKKKNQELILTRIHLNSILILTRIQRIYLLIMRNQILASIMIYIKVCYMIRNLRSMIIKAVKIKRKTQTKKKRKLSD